MTAFDFAARGGHKEALELLLSQGADTGSLDEES